MLTEQNVAPADRFLIALSRLSVEDAKAFIDASDPVNTRAVLLNYCYAAEGRSLHAMARAG